MKMRVYCKINGHLSAWNAIAQNPKDAIDQVRWEIDCKKRSVLALVHTDTDTLKFESEKVIA